ncbi:galactose-binding domain-like protein [Bacillus phage vB_BanH_Emiliahah]|nr:galactose-binding domain-like protein [Bacillus phage vB_BanH_Emiliahah]
MEFKQFKKELKKNFNGLVQEVDHLFEVEVDKDVLWDTYLNSFPEGTNEIFRERREFDCSACRNFIRNMGNVVVIKDNQVHTIWDFQVESTTFQPVLDALSKFIKSRAVTDVWVNKFKKIGTDSNLEQVGAQIFDWQHLHVEVPDKFVTRSSSSEAEIRGGLRDTRNVFLRSLVEISEESVMTVLELIASNTLYKGAEWKSVLTQFLTHERAFLTLQTDAEKNNYAWEQSVKVGAAMGRIRNHSIGTLLVNISEGMDLDRAVKAYEVIVAPSNYKRPKAIFTKKMLEEAQKTIQELGYMESLGRRYARLEDITVNNVLFSNKLAARRMGGNIFEEMMSEVAVNPKQFARVEEISIESFLTNVLPTAQELELFLENKHANSMVSLIAPENAEAPTMFKWANPFSWAYSGNITDSSMKENVKSAGGNVDGVLRFSIQWNDEGYDGNDLDAHCIEPDSYRIYFANKRQLSPNGGMLDVDIRMPRRGTPAVENITWANKATMKEGTYKMIVHNYSHNGGRTGFRAEIEGDGQIRTYDYNKEVRQGEYVEVAEVYFDGTNFRFSDKLASSVSSKDVWGLKTNQFVPVSVMMFSPNYWDEQKGIGHQHYFFMLKDCVNPENPNGFYNEFLKADLEQHKRVFEALGGKMAVKEVEDQLSGVGFSSTKRNEVLIKVKGQTERVVKVKF